MNKLRFRKNTLLIATMLALLSLKGASASDMIEFDDSIMKAMGFDNVDLSAFSGSGDQFLGTYSAEVKLNSNTILSDYSIQFYQANDGSELCITEALASDIFVKQEFIDVLKKSSKHSVDEGDCLDLVSLDAAISVLFNASDQIVNITLPQAYIDNVDPSWVSPKRRDYGVPGVIFDYSLVWNYDREKDSYTGRKESKSSVRSYGTVGGNIGWLRVRADYQYYSKAREDDKKFEWAQIYGFTDLPSLNAKLFVGEINSRSNIFDTARIKGASLYSDENMMPSYLRGYAPQITGVASSNAIVTISQYGGVIRTEQVPAGPFVISDLPSYITGVVSVEIEEANGQTRNYQVDIAQVPFLTRKGAARYSVNIGRLDPLWGDKIGTSLTSFDLSYGLMNNVSVYGGAQYTTNNEYKAFNLGVGFNLGQFGALSFDITKSNNKVSELGVDDSGTSYRFNYAKRFTSSTTVNIAGYRFSSRGFTSLNNYITMKQAQDAFAPSFEKNRFTLSVSQQFSDLGLSVTGTLSKTMYWNNRSMSNYAISVSKYIRKEGFFNNSNISLTFSQDKSEYYDDNKRISLYISLPLESNDNNGRIQYGARYNTLDRMVDQNVQYFANGLGGEYSIGATAYHKKDLSGSIDYSMDARYDVDTGYGRFNSSADYKEHRQNVRAGFEGSLTLTKYGLATHSRSFGAANARLILDAGAPGVRMANGIDVSNTFGLAGISNISSYSYGSYQIDNDNLPENVEIPNGIVDVAVTDGAIAYRSLGGISGEKSISTITLSDGSYPPFGATVYRENGDDREIAIVADQGLTYLTGLKKNVKFVVKWGSTQSCELKIDSLDSENLQNLTCY